MQEYMTLPLNTILKSINQNSLVKLQIQLAFQESNQSHLPKEL